MIRQSKVALDDVVDATNTSRSYPMAGVCKATFYFKRTNHTSGSSKFEIEGSVDGTNYVTLKKLISDVTNTNSQNYTRVDNVTLSSNTASIASLDLTYDTFAYVRVKVTRTTDGTSRCVAVFEREDE